MVPCGPWREGSLIKGIGRGRALRGALLLFLCGAFFYWVRPVLPPFAIAAFMAYVLDPAVSALAHRGIGRSVGILVVYLVLALVGASFILYFVPAFVRDITDLAGQIPDLVAAVQAYAASAKELISRYNLPAGIERGVVSSLLQAEAFLSRVGEDAFSYFLSSATVLSWIVVAPVIAYYILRDMNRWREEAFVAMSRYPLPFVDVVTGIDRVIAGFVRGQSIVAAAVAVLVWIASMALGLRFGAAFGLIAGLGEFVPYFGPIVAAIPAILAAFVKGTAAGLWMLGLIVAIQWLDANLIVPRVTGPCIGLHPLWIVFALLVGGRFLGFWGLFVAVPAAGVAAVILRFGRALWGG